MSNLRVPGEFFEQDWDASVVMLVGMHHNNQHATSLPYKDNCGLARN